MIISRDQIQLNLADDVGGFNRPEIEEEESNHEENQDKKPRPRSVFDACRT